MPNIQPRSLDFVKRSDSLRELSQGINELILFREQILPTLIQLIRAKRGNEDIVIPLVASLGQLPSSAIPTQALIEILEDKETSNFSTRLCLAWALAEAGITSELVVQAFIDALKVGASKDKISSSAAAMLTAFPSIYTDVANHFVAELVNSSGETQRIAAQVLKYRLGEKAQKGIPDNMKSTFEVLLDEPFTNSGGLDPLEDPWFCSWNIPEKFRWKCSEKRS